MSERKILELIESVSDIQYRKTNDRQWLKLAIFVAKWLNEGKRYDKWARRG